LPPLDFVRRSDALLGTFMAGMGDKYDESKMVMLVGAREMI
jgi:hypothetical protein